MIVFWLAAVFMGASLFLVVTWVLAGAAASHLWIKRVSPSGAREILASLVRQAREGGDPSDLCDVYREKVGGLWLTYLSWPFNINSIHPIFDAADKYLEERAVKRMAALSRRLYPSTPSIT